MSLFEIAIRFIASDEFKDLYKDPAKLSNGAFVDILYLNVLDRPGEEGGFNYWLGQLNGGESRQSVLTKFAVSAENYEGSPYVTSIANDGSGHWDFAF